MILGEVEETVNYYEIDDETYEETLKVRHTPFPPGNEKKKERTTKRRQTSCFHETQSTRKTTTADVTCFFVWSTTRPAEREEVEALPVREG